MRLSKRAESRHERDLRAAQLAEGQWGVLSLRQAERVGLDRNAVRRRAHSTWEGVLPGVYRVRGAPRTWEQEVMAACLWAGPQSAASHLTAAHLWRLDGVTERAIEVSVPRACDRHASGVVVHRTQDWRLEDRTLLHGVPVTRPPRTLIDLAGVVDEASLELALDDALRRRLVNPEWLNRIMRRTGGKGRRGVATLRRLLEQHERRGEATDSPLEARVLQLIRQARLPRPVVHFDVWDGDHRIGEVDFAFPRQRLAIEAEGRRYHDSDAAWASDRDRWSALAAAGWRVIPVTWQDATQRPTEVAQRIRRALEASRAEPGRRSRSR